MADNNKTSNFGMAFSVKVTIGNQEFKGSIIHEDKDDNTICNLLWINTNLDDSTKKLVDMAKDSHVDNISNLSVPLSFRINGVFFGYATLRNEIKLAAYIGNAAWDTIAVLEIYRYDSEEAVSSGSFQSNKDLEAVYGAKICLKYEISLKGIPLVGEILDDGDSIRDFSLNFSSNGGTTNFGASFIIRIKSKDYEIELGKLFEKISSFKENITDNIVSTGNKVSEIIDSVNDEDDSSKSIETDGKYSDSEQKGTGISWVNIDKTLGPFTLQRIGFKFDSGFNIDSISPNNTNNNETSNSDDDNQETESKVVLYLDAKITFSIITLELAGLHLGIPISELCKFNKDTLKALEFGLDGLAIDFNNGGLQISGCLLKDGDRYDGAIVVRYGIYEFAAVASYSKLDNGESSLFIYIMVGFPIGGTPAFFITGLAAGFGFNRGLKIPDIDGVRAFPLISMVYDDNKNYTLMDAVKLLKDVVYESQGNYFFAIGIKFTTFELVKSFALVTVSFGHGLELHILGLSSFSLPPKLDKRLVYAELALKISIMPSQGLISIEAKLTSESFIFYKDCKLTGGFAFFVWFGSNKHSGDFVLSLGGYHPRYNKPDHFPNVDRIGINWKITNHLSLKGESYFTLTSNAIMGGGALSLEYKLGGLKAWFEAYADFLIQWAPFYYDISLGVSIGVSYTFKIFGCKKTLKVELGASLRLYGPEFAGEVYISWFIISFTIKFGSRNSEPPKLSWNETKDKFLEEPLKTRVARGLIKCEEVDEDRSVSLVNVKEASFAFTSKIPVTGYTIGNSDEKVERSNQEDVGVLPMGENRKLNSLAKILIFHKEDEEYIDVSKEKKDALEILLVNDNIPKAMWSRSEVNPYVSETIKNITTGIVVSIKNQEEVDINSYPDDGAAVKSDQGVFVRMYPLDILTKNERCYTPNMKKSEVICHIEDYLDENIQTVIDDAVKTRPIHVVMDKIHSVKDNSVDDLLMAGFNIWRSSELDDDELYSDIDGSYMTPPVKREINII